MVDMSKDSERRYVLRQLQKTAKAEAKPSRPSFYDTPPYQPGGHFYEQTPEGKAELKKRKILVHTYQPGDILKVDYAFGTYSTPIPNGTEVKFQGWAEYAFVEGDENMAYEPPSTKPGIFRSYSEVKVEYEGESVMLSYSHVTLVNGELAQTRLNEWGEKAVPTGFIRVGDFSEKK